MNDKEINAVINLNANKRYEYFIKKVADFEEVWGLYNQGWVQAEDDNHNITITFWPNKEYATLCAIGEWSNCIPKSIALEKFISKWIPGMKKNSLKPCVFLTPNDKGIVVDCEKLLKDLYEELENY